MADQNEDMKKRKIPYEAPRLFDLSGGTAYSASNCRPGNTASGARCQPGNVAGVIIRRLRGRGRGGSGSTEVH